MASAVVIAGLVGYGAFRTSTSRMVLSIGCSGLDAVTSDCAYCVRPASTADLLAVLQILAESRAENPHEGVPSIRQPSHRQKVAWERVTATTDLTVYLAETETEAVGTASMMVMPHVTYDCRPTAFIEAVVVKYAHRRRGVARLLLQQALTDARAASCLKVQLLSHKSHSHDGAHDLYRAMGFTAEAEGFRLYIRLDS